LSSTEGSSSRRIKHELKMDNTTHKIATSANLRVYGEDGTRKYVDGAPHIKHDSVWSLYLSLLGEVLTYARQFSDSPQVLDLGAGEGSVTLPLIDMGATVTAVDVSVSQLNELRNKCSRYGGRLRTECDEVHSALKRLPGPYDIIVVNSFLHHIPDYLAMIRLALPRIADRGQFFSFQDPLRYDSISKFNRAFSQAGYFSWRIFQGDIWGGFKRLVRRSRGVYVDDCEFDNTEYHVTRGGVDQEAIAATLVDSGF
jgi:2-polyprenyl-3-methyl-5-hydroxy-6-metoxy-1,4-benzoquinol methylase